MISILVIHKKAGWASECHVTNSNDDDCNNRRIDYAIIVIDKWQPSRHYENAPQTVSRC